MAPKNPRDQLLDFLDRKMFEPVLKASPDDYESDNDKKKLEGVQKTTRSTQESYHKLTTPERVRNEFRGDLNSEAAKKVHNELRSLHLPTANDVKDEFEQLYDKLGVGR
ncbi:MAG: hypothetical protein M3Q08_07420 [Pseudomonadota bacterium]|nr:hypothetical protein [Chloroflexota bacterium]MDP9413909.1 hypothetical protein [Pseudomonadota bacterium]